MKESSRTRRKETTKKERKLKRRRKGGKRKLKGKERMMDTTIMDWRKTQGRKKRRKWKKGITQGQEIEARNRRKSARKCTSRE